MHLTSPLPNLQAVETIRDMATLDPKELANALRFKHRTLQQSFVRNLVKTLEEWAYLQDNQTDDRNFKAIEWLNEVVSISENITFPLI